MIEEFFICYAIFMTDFNEHNLLIDIKDLTRGYYDSPTMLFHKFNFALYKKDFCIVMGKSGVWKSTLIKIITWQIKPPMKAIYHRNEDIARYTEEEVQLFRRKIWIVFQDYKLIEELTVQENVVYPLKIYGYSPFTMEKKFKELSEKLNIQKLADVQVKFLSAGEKQKVALARAMVHDPEFIIVDEPTGNLDREHTQHIADILMEINKAWNTVLLITHDVHLMNYIKSKQDTKLVVM